MQAKLRFLMYHFTNSYQNSFIIYHEPQDQSALELLNKANLFPFHMLSVGKITTEIIFSFLFMHRSAQAPPWGAFGANNFPKLTVKFVGKKIAKIVPRTMTRNKTVRSAITVIYTVVWFWSFVHKKNARSL